MKSKSVFKSVCVFVGLGFLLTIVWLMIFSMTITPDDAEMAVEPFSGASVTFGFACALIANFIYQYNSAKSLEQRIYSNTSSLESIKIRNRDLIDKANRLIDKHQKNEKESYIDIAKASYTKKEERHEKNTKDRLKTYSDEDVLVTSSQEFGNFINDFPELSNNQNVKILFDEIINSENYLSNSKIELNRCIESYNSLIHQFPLVLLRKPLKFTDKKFYREEVQITDKMLGI
ncbi:MAG: LemA family protein [Anaerococcus vaginalis]|uniref:LemA family protein n=1 Tax=Anaerococcus vaginalis TaxID=33037 RepID=UPI00290D0AE9|nr:LemA family protein [Anaerococcus vaginalis]